MGRKIQITKEIILETALRALMGTSCGVAAILPPVPLKPSVDSGQSQIGSEITETER